MGVKNGLMFQFCSTRLETNQPVGIPTKLKPFKKMPVGITTMHS
jgi:hypothetical protein